MAVYILTRHRRSLAPRIFLVREFNERNRPVWEGPRGETGSNLQATSIDANLQASFGDGRRSQQRRWPGTPSTSSCPGEHTSSEEESPAEMLRSGARLSPVEQIPSTRLVEFSSLLALSHVPADGTSTVKHPTSPVPQSWIPDSSWPSNSRNPRKSNWS